MASAVNSMALASLSFYRLQVEALTDADLAARERGNVSRAELSGDATTDARARVRRLIDVDRFDRAVRREGDLHVTGARGVVALLAASERARDRAEGRRRCTAIERRRAARERRTTGREAGRRRLEADDIAALVERIDAEAAGRRTHQALHALPEGVRAVLELIAVDGLTVTEAAAALGIRPVTARVRLHRARRVLRDLVPEAGRALAYAKEGA